MIEDLTSLLYRGVGWGLGHTSRGIKNQIAKGRQRERAQAISQTGTRPELQQGDYPPGAWTQYAIPAVAGCRTPPGWSPFHESRARQTREAIGRGQAPAGIWQQGLIYPVPFEYTVNLVEGTDTGSRYVCDMGGEPILLRESRNSTLSTNPTVTYSSLEPRDRESRSSKATWSATGRHAGPSPSSSASKQGMFTRRWDFP